MAEAFLVSGVRTPRANTAVPLSCTNGRVPTTAEALDWADKDVETSTRSSSTRPSPLSSLACVCRLGLDTDAVNADGGIIMLGHPLSCSGGPEGLSARSCVRR